MLPSWAVAQEQPTVEKSTEKVRIEGQIYYVHNVKKGETIYSLCKVYKVSEETLLKYNPQLAGGLKIGYVLKVPDAPQAAAAEVKPGTNQPTHEVQRKETLYSIAQMYGCTVEDIRQANPTINENIKKGQVLIIPTKKTAQTTQTNLVQTPPKSETTDKQSPSIQTPAPVKTDAPRTGNHIYYTVLKDETLYTISQRYAVTEKELKTINPDAFKKGELMEGAILRIPSQSQETVSVPAVATVTSTSTSAALFPSDYNSPENTKSTTPQNTYSYRTGDPFNVALLLPLRNKTAKPTDDGTKQTYSYVEFYEGALLAIDSLKKTGLSVNLSVYDVNNDSELDNALQNEGLRTAQLIIGPVQKELLSKATQFAQAQEIPIVLPASTLSDSLVSQMPNVIEIKNIEKCAEQQLLNDLCKTNRNVVLVHKSGINSELVSSYKQKLEELGCKPKMLSYSILKSRNDLLSTLSKEKENHVVVIPCSDDAFITDFISTLNLLTATNKLTVYTYGDARWRKMTNLSIPTLYSLNLRVAQPFYVDYTSDDTKRFVAGYRYYYKGEPTEYSFLGYDVMFYFLEMLKTYGSNFVSQLPKTKKDMLQSRFVFKQLEHGGMRNQGTFTLEYLPSFDIVRK